MYNKYKLQKIEKLKENNNFLPFAESMQKEYKCEHQHIYDFILSHFDAVIDNFELLEFLKNSDINTINSVTHKAIKEINKEFNF